MSMHPLVGHDQERRRIQQALDGDRLPQLVLLSGPAGVGKQRFALWMAAAILCETTGTRPCGECSACRKVTGLAHPDVHWFMPVPRPKAGDSEKQLEEVAELYAAALEERRAEALYQPADGLAGHFVSTARLLQRRAALTPVMGRRKVFIVAEADRLVPQESSPEAANALLKLLEEPPGDSQFILTVVDANRLLPTIRSRAVPLRLGRLPDKVVELFLAAHGGASGPELRRRVAHAGGSIGRALALGDELAKASESAGELLRAVKAGAGSRAERALKQGPWAARGDFTAMLDALAHALAEQAREAAATTRPEGQEQTGTLEALVQAQLRVGAAREAAQGNVNPQLLLSALADDLAEAL
jgi:DNA polymerase III subunit delta'